MLLMVAIGAPLAAHAPGTEGARMAPKKSDAVASLFFGGSVWLS